MGTGNIGTGSIGRLGLSADVGVGPLAALLDAIPALDGEAMDAARARQAQLTKPAGALGKLEELSIRLAGMTGQARPRLQHKAIVVAAADHGICAAGVSAYPQSVTAQMVANFLRGGAAINVLAQQAGARLTVVDMGLADAEAVSIPAIEASAGVPLRFVARPIAQGTANFAQGPAMTREQAAQAILAGATVVAEECAAGLDLLGLGEMGIGNTSAATAVACALTGRDPVHMVGRGAGLDDAGLARKLAAIRQGLRVNDLMAEEPGTAKHSGADFALEVLARVGGFELGALTGAILGAARRRVPVLVDGFIATAAAMLAVQLALPVRDFLLAAHLSAEPGHATMLAWLGLEPYLALDMRLGEGTGAALCMAVVDAAWRTLDGMATFVEAGVADKGPVAAKSS